ncbi:MAG: citramalate synthase [Nitrospinota bacterium]
MTRKIEIYDTTLRDGCQAEDISFSLEDKLRIARRLDETGFHFVEGGWPGANPKDTEFFKEIKKYTLKNATIVAFGSTCRPGKTPETDPLMKDLLSAETECVTILGKTWDLHVTDALKTSLSKNLEIIEESIGYLKKNVKKVIFDAEHFFDGFKRNREYALKAIQAAEKGGADTIVLCDTNGGTLAHDVGNVVQRVQSVVGSPLGIHAHNDSETAVASSLIAVTEGAVQVQGTINGYGERCGNANLCSVIPNLKIKMGLSCISSPQLKKLQNLSNFVDELANLKHQNRRPYVGKSAFAHKGGIHVNAVMKNSETYEHIQPKLVGNSQRILVSDQAGKSNILLKAKQYGIDIESDDEAAKKILKEIKKLESEGFEFEGAEGSFELLMKEAKGKRKSFYELKGFRVIVEKRRHDQEPISEATVKVVVNNKTEITAAEGNGPVNALDNALRKGLEKFYPHLSEAELLDFKVRILDERHGTGAKTRVLIESGDKETSWGTVGVHENVIEASWQALVDSVDYKLHKKRKKA